MNRTDFSRRSVLAGIGVAGATVVTPGIAAANSAPQSSVPAARQTGPLSDREALETFLDDLMEEHLETHAIAGATVAVVDGDAEFAKGYGYADLDAETPVDAAETLFRIGSVSKLFTWTAAMQAVERGDLAIDEDVDAAIEAVDLPETYEEPIRLDHLATHTPGFEERVRGTFVQSEAEMKPLAETLRSERPARVRPPGEFAAYSNYGSALAGQLVAETAGSSFEAIVETDIFEPFSMDRSTFEQPVPDDLAGNLSNGYRADADGLTEGDFEYVGIPPAGAMSATASDMASFVRAFLQDGAVDDGRLLEPESIAEMHRRRFGHDDRLNGIAFGFYEMHRNGVRVLGHGGDTELFHSILFLIPDHDVGVFVSYNSTGGIDARSEFVDAFFERYVPETGAETPTPNEPPERADAITGTYRSNRIPYTTSEKFTGFPATIGVSIDDEGRLVTELPDGETTKWVEIEPLLFAEVDGTNRLAFREADGAITHLFLDSTPVTAFERLSRREQPIVHLALLAMSALVFLTAAVGWPLAAGWRRYRGATIDGGDADSPLRYARWVAGGTSAAFLAFVVAFGAVLATDPTWLLLGDPLRFRLLLAVSLLGAIGTVLTAGLAAWTWYERSWGLPARLHYTAVAVAGVAVCWVLAYWNLLWYQA